MAHGKSLELKAQDTMDRLRKRFGAGVEPRETRVRNRALRGKARRKQAREHREGVAYLESGAGRPPSEADVAFIESLDEGRE